LERLAGGDSPRGSPWNGCGRAAETLNGVVNHAHVIWMAANMQSSEDAPTITADAKGIHFQGTRDRDIIVHWGEIESIDAIRFTSQDGTDFHEVYVNHISGVDFRFHSVDRGYAEVMASMELHLHGFVRSAVDSAGSWDEKADQPFVWKRDEKVQRFELQPPVFSDRPPTEQERAQMAAAHAASVSTCERIMGRPLLTEELKCVYTGFENARIVGRIDQPLADQLIARQSESSSNDRVV
jgi:hypothetical protein